MAFYDLDKTERIKLVEQIAGELLLEIQEEKWTKTIEHFGNSDTYIRKSAYLAMGKIYRHHKELRKNILSRLETLIKNPDFRIRQTSVNTAGEIGIREFDTVSAFFEKGLFDEHHSVRNAVIGSVKKMSEKNPVPVLTWAKKYLHHPDKEIRREICHGIELRGRTHPQDILPLLQELQHDETARVRNTLVHVLGQIAYKKDCLATVMNHLQTWENKDVVKKAVAEIIDVHNRYKNFAILTQEQAREYIAMNYENSLAFQ